MCLVVGPSTEKVRRDRDATVFHVVEDELFEAEVRVEGGADALDHLRRRQLGKGAAAGGGRGQGGPRGAPAEGKGPWTLRKASIPRGPSPPISSSAPKSTSCRSS